MVISDQAVVLPLARDAQSVRRARRLVSEVLTDGKRTSHLDTALLLVSELVGNAVRYGAEPITLDLAQDGEALIIGVTDGSTTMPALPAIDSGRERGETTCNGDLRDDLSDSESVGGRGLQLVATLSDSWGVQKREQDKRVWFVLRRTVGS